MTSRRLDRCGCALDSATIRCKTGAPSGWIIPRSSPRRISRLAGLLEAEQRIVGFLGSVPTQFVLGDQRVLAVSAHAMVIEPEYRRSNRLRIAEPLFSLAGVDLVLNTSANPGSGRIFQAFQAARVPSPEYDRCLMWVLQPAVFLRSYLRRRGAFPSSRCRTRTVRRRAARGRQRRQQAAAASSGWCKRICCPRDQ